MLIQKEKENVLVFVLGIINIIIAFSITNLLGITNTIVLKTFSFIYSDITVELIILMLLYITEILIIKQKGFTQRYIEN